MITHPTIVHPECRLVVGLASLMVGLALVSASVLAPEPAVLPARHPTPPATVTGRTIARPLAFLARRDVVPDESAALVRERVSATGSWGSRPYPQPGVRLFLLGTAIQLHAPQTAALLRPPSEVPARYRLVDPVATPAPDRNRPLADGEGRGAERP